MRTTSYWEKLKAYANRKGIKIIGDIPIYVAFDSSDAWANPELFQFDEDCNPTAVAGCPPDAFAADLNLLIPLHPANIAEGSLHRHIKRIIVQPVSIILHKDPGEASEDTEDVNKPAAKESMSGVLIGVICAVALAVVGGILIVLGNGKKKCDIPSLYQILRIDEIGIAREGRKGLIRGVPVPGRTKGQYLPIRLMRRLRSACQRPWKSIAQNLPMR